jgi:hypothetical protein
LSIVAGNQVPFTPFGEAASNVGTEAPEQIGATSAKSGIVGALIVTLRVCKFEHSPALGVNIYDPELILSITDGDQIPFTPFGEITAKLGDKDPEQYEAVVGNPDGVTGVITTFKV